MCAMNMPPEREARIRAIPGNKTCADCSNINPQWASVSYGILVCLECSGHHRALGVHLSFVRSVQMDSWTEKQMEAMERSGGNVALEKFLSSRGITKNWPVAAKYGTKQAAYYRERLSRWLDGKTEPPPDPGNYDPVSGGDAQGAEPLPGESTDDYNARQARLREAARERLRAKFGDGAMGGVGSSGATSYGTSSGGVEDWGLGEIGGAAVGAASKVGGAVGTVVGGVGNFLKANVLENTDLHASVRNQWASIRQSVSQSDIDNYKKTVSADEENSLRRSMSWGVGAMGEFLQNASEGLGKMMDDGEGSSQAPPAPRCPKNHKLRTSPASATKCDLCPARGTRYACCDGCDYNICTKCFEKPVEGRSTPGSKGMTFDDDWGEDAPPAAPTKEDMNKIAQDLGMRLDTPKTRQPASKPEESKRVSATPAPKPTPAAATPQKPKPKEKAKLPDADDFFAEFGV